MPYSSFRPVVPLCKGLFQPLHDCGQFQSIRRLNVKRQPVILKTQPADFESKPAFRLLENPGKQYQGFKPTEQRFPVVDAGANFVPHPLFQSP
jgi:hypothetical protein